MTARSHDDRRRDDRTACRCDPDLIDADDALEARIPESALVAKIGRVGKLDARADGRVPPADQPLVRRSRRVAALPTRSRRK